MARATVGLTYSNSVIAWSVPIVLLSGNSCVRVICGNVFLRIVQVEKKDALLLLDGFPTSGYGMVLLYWLDNSVISAAKDNLTRQAFGK